MISLIRIDDRLIHGQVVCGWGIKLNPNRYVIIDDFLEKWEAELYVSCLENESCGCVTTTKDAAYSFGEWQSSKEHIVILVKEPKTLEKLEELGDCLPDINLGGLHYLEGKKRYLNCLYLYDEERESLKRLCDKHKVSYQPLPSDHKIDVNRIL